MQTQKSWVLNQLKKGRTVTPLQALDGCGTIRLAAIIHDLRESGVNILTIRATTKAGNKYASYKMVKPK